MALSGGWGKGARPKHLGNIFRCPLQSTEQFNVFPHIFWWRYYQGMNILQKAQLDSWDTFLEAKQPYPTLEGAQLYTEFYCPFSMTYMDLK